jgi:hypothetical protein
MYDKYLLIRSQDRTINIVIRHIIDEYPVIMFYRLFCVIFLLPKLIPLLWLHNDKYIILSLK